MHSLIPHVPLTSSYSPTTEQNFAQTSQFEACSKVELKELPLANHSDLRKLSQADVVFIPWPKYANAE